MNTRRVAEVNLYGVRKSINKLKRGNRFGVKHDYSTWFKYRHEINSVRRNRSVSSSRNIDLLGQFNFFFRMSFPDDFEPLLDCIPLASTVMRKSSYISIPINDLDNRGLSSDDDKKLTRMMYVDTKEVEESYMDDIRFVPLTSVYSCAMAVVPLNQMHTNATSFGFPVQASEIKRKSMNERHMLGGLLYIGLHNFRLKAVMFDQRRIAQLYHNRGLDSDLGVDMNDD